jgi:16S rRNA (uracil1498-N3)-methyltransferase
MRRRFFVERFESNSAQLTGDAAEHLGRVLRAEPGQLYELSDGRELWLGRIERVALSKQGRSRIEFALVQSLPARQPGLKIELLLSLVKFDRFEWCLEKATELGASLIVPLAAARTDQPLALAALKRHARWEKIVLESAQQSRRLRPPDIAARSAPEKAFAACNANLKILLSERRGATSLREVLSNEPPGHAGSSVDTAALAIGPEGGWTDEESSAARAAGFVEVSLGENILRTETAVLAAMAVVNFALGVE